MLIPVERLRVGESGIIRRIAGGRGLMRRLDAMGLRPGKSITKLSSQFMGGPVTVVVDGRHVAMGRGMAAKVLVERVCPPPGAGR